LSIQTFASVLLRNEGALTFTPINLPDAVQTGPVKAIATGDLDGNGHLDFLYFGNHFPVEVETARFDGLVHGICFGEGTGAFRAQAFSAVEPFMGDYRDVLLLPGVPGTVQFVLTQNDGPAMLYKLVQTGKMDN
jgi:hypothetical protein